MDECIVFLLLNSLLSILTVITFCVEFVVAISALVLFFYITNLLIESIKLFLECSFVFTTITLTLDSLFGSYFYKNIFGTNLIFPKKCEDK